MMTRPKRSIRRLVLTGALLLTFTGISGCTGLQHWGEDWQSLGPAFSEWGTDIFGDTSPEW